MRPFCGLGLHSPHSADSPAASPLPDSRLPSLSAQRYFKKQPSCFRSTMLIFQHMLCLYLLCLVYLFILKDLLLYLREHERGEGEREKQTPTERGAPAGMGPATLGSPPEPRPRVHCSAAGAPRRPALLNTCLCLSWDELPEGRDPTKNGVGGVGGAAREPS